jgi:hypothetical protein
MDSSEIGEALGRPDGTVRYQLAEARRRLAAGMALEGGVKVLGAPETSSVLAKAVTRDDNMECSDKALGGMVA